MLISGCIAEIHLSLLWMNTWFRFYFVFSVLLCAYIVVIKAYSSVPTFSHLFLICTSYVTSDFAWIEATLQVIMQPNCFQSSPGLLPLSSVFLWSHDKCCTRVLKLQKAKDEGYKEPRISCANLQNFQRRIRGMKSPHSKGLKVKLRTHPHAGAQCVRKTQDNT